MKRGLVILLLGLALTIPLVSAVSDFPLNLIDNEWAKLAIVFLVLFASIYYFFNNRMENPPIAGIISIGLALLITIPIMKRELIDPLLNPEIVDWALIIAIIAGFLFIIYWLYKKLKWKGIILGLLILTILPLFIDLEEILPESIIYGPVGDFIEIIQGFSNIILIGVIGIIIIWIIWKIKNFFSGNQQGAQNININVGRQRQPRRKWSARKNLPQTSQRNQGYIAPNRIKSYKLAKK